jgi:hypothetical protein
MMMLLVRLCISFKWLSSTLWKQPPECIRCPPASTPDNIRYPKIIAWLSRPLLLWQLGEYWFRLSHYVYDCNRPLAPILRQSRCSLMYDVHWLEDDIARFDSWRYIDSVSDICRNNSGVYPIPSGRDEVLLYQHRDVGILFWARFILPIWS